ncbi:MAG: penicillin-binding protein 2 [Acidimicrobiales bacterium]|jgi:cell division protein FtsI (penicillin-binding protein 3)|nr:penicillin-binding protein 2 [Acidimicrobiales bacterium]
MSRRPAPAATSGRGSRRLVPRQQDARRLRRRCIATGVVFVLAAAALLWRLVSLQVLEPDRYLEHGEAQRIRSISLPAARGAILDRNGVDLALSVPLQTIAADPRQVEDPIRAARALAQIVDTDVAVLEERLASGKAFVYIDRQVEEEVARTVLDLELLGIYTIQERARLRPGNDSTIALLGRTDIDDNGVSGLEMVHDDLLSGAPGEMIVETGARGATIPGGEYQVEPAALGRDLVLSIDRSLQFEAERLLLDGVEAAGANSGILVAMDPDTGELLASAAVIREDGMVRPSSEHRAATWSFEPGSIMKALTFSAVLETGLGAVSSVREVPGWVHVHDSDFRDSFPHDEEDWSIADVIQKSSNVGTILWAVDLGEERLYEQLLDFGLGQRTPLDFPGEASGILPAVGRWSGTSLPTIAIGQGVAVTPLQMASAFSAIANGGELPAPTLVLGSRDTAGMFTAADVPAPTRVIDTETARHLVDMLEGVVEVGTGTNAQVPGYRVAGKTGTAWKPQPEGGYGEGSGNVDYIASFVGMLPAEDPELVVLVVVDEPALHSYSGGRAAAPIFADFAQFAVRQRRIPSEAERIGLEEDGRVMAATPAQVAALEAAEALAREEAERASDEVAAASAGG